ncbi:MAG: DUF2007 domain-containing protein [Actinomycetota bacterium]|nr:DUF2007 domain-containing protein [Actinomycetota bacterium]
MSTARMSPAPLVHVRTVPTAFHARVIAARLGAEGIPTQLRGNVGGPYPIGNVSVWVTEADADVASELLLADEIEAAFDVHPDDMEPSPSTRRVVFGLTRRQILATLCLVAMGVAAFFSRLNI